MEPRLSIHHPLSSLSFPHNTLLVPWRFKDFVILVIIGHNLIKYIKCVIGTILSEGIHEYNSSLEPIWKDIKVGMMRKGFSTSECLRSQLITFRY
jgi:hypothetical protein